MRVWCVLGVGLALAVTGLSATAGDAAAQASGPTFTKDVAPILFAGCVTCHRPGEIAPMSLLSYEEARPWAKAIRDKVVSREMPPWHADPRYGKFRNDRSLTVEQIATIVAWANGGAPKGRDEDLPAPPTVVAGWSYGSDPDTVIEMPVTFNVPAEGEVPYVNFWTRVPFQEDRFARVLEYRPSNHAVVHHAEATLSEVPEGGQIVGGKLLFADGSSEDERAERRRHEGLNNSTVMSPETFNHLASYIPGQSLYEYFPGTGKRIRGGKYIRFSLHYSPTGRPEIDRTKLGLWFNDGDEVHEVYDSGVGQPIRTASDRTSFYLSEGRVATNGPRERGFPNIPPYAENFKVTGVTPISEPITLYSFFPHMHLRGKDMMWILTWPDGREQVLLSVPKYDFNWQIEYVLEEPLKLPAGSTLTSIAHYDNSAKNRYNPAPDAQVYWSEQSWDEMFQPVILYTVDRQAPAKMETGASQQQ